MQSERRCSIKADSEKVDWWFLAESAAALAATVAKFDPRTRAILATMVATSRAVRRIVENQEPTQKDIVVINEYNREVEKLPQWQSPVIREIKQGKLQMLSKQIEDTDGNN